MKDLAAPLVTNDAVVLGLLVALLALIFYTSSSNKPGWKKFYGVIPMLLLCYFVPSLLTTFGIVAPQWYDVPELIAHLNGLGLDVHAEMSLETVKEAMKAGGVESSELSQFKHQSQLYYVASRFLLPASLVLLTLSINLKEVFQLGPKALIMFFTGTFGVIIGGPIAILLTSYIAPDVVGGQGPDEIWRGMATVAGSWIGGGANQAAMYEIFKPSDKLYSVMITVDIIVAEIWMFFLLLGVGRHKSIDKWLKADSSSVDHLQKKMHDFSQKIARIPSTTDFFIILGFGFGATAVGHWLAGELAPFFDQFALAKKLSLNSSFFWLIVIATTLGLGLSFTKARNYEGAGASKIGSVFIYMLVATIGMKMDVREIVHNYQVFGVGLIWMAIHVSLLFIVAKLIKAPYFFLAVGSKANIGGAASAPVVAAAFHPSLAPVGVLLAVLGYAVGTYGAWLCAILMSGAA